MLEVGEDRAAERVEEGDELRGADEVLGECTVDQSKLSQDEASRTLRVAESVHLESVDLVVPPP